MKTIKPSVQLIPQPRLPTDMLKHIELCSRVCYKSEDRITDGSAEGFVQRVIARGHEAVLEHGNIILRLDADSCRDLTMSINRLEQYHGFRSFLRRTINHATERYIVSGNVRAWRDFISVYTAKIENRPPYYLHSMMQEYGVLFDGLYQERVAVQGTPVITPDELEGDIEILTHRCETVRFIADRGVSHEIVRHRPASYCQESTRYCNYAKGDFGGEITVIQPRFFQAGTPLWSTWIEACAYAERYYFDLLKGGATAQEARTVLPNSLKTEIVMTATLGEWVHFFKLRCAEAAHPQMREVATQARELLLNETSWYLDKWLGEAGCAK